MQLIQPQVKALQAKHKNDRAEIQEETMKLYSEHCINPFASCPALVLCSRRCSSACTRPSRASAAEAPAYQASVEALNQASFLWRSRIWASRTPTTSSVVYVVSQMISTELMVATQSDEMQKWIMRAMPIVFVLFLFNFLLGLSCTGSRRTSGPSAAAGHPQDDAEAGRARGERQDQAQEAQPLHGGHDLLRAGGRQQREQRIAQKSGDQTGAKTGASAGRRKKPAQGAKKAAPPGKGKRKPGRARAASGPDRRANRARTGTDRARRRQAQGPGGQTKPPAGAPDKPATKQSPGGWSAGGDQGANTSADGPADD